MPRARRSLGGPRAHPQLGEDAPLEHRAPRGDAPLGVGRSQQVGARDRQLDAPGQPLFYSKRGAQIHLWPKPSALYQYTILGYRIPSNWILLGAGTPPDCDDRLHVPIADWALSRYFKQQEDPVMAQAYEQSFKDGVALAHDSIMRIDQDYPLILNKGWVNPSINWWLQSLGRGLGN